MGSALLGLLILATTAPVAAWSPVGDHASLQSSGSATRRAADPPGHGVDAPPVESLHEALAAGGRQASRRAKTVFREGIDVSHWQGRIHWKQVARSGVDFVVAKATEGTWRVDPRYHQNRKRAEKAGLLFTAYHFANPSRERGDARREADWFLKHARLDGGNLLPALDLETTGGLNAVELRRWTLQWMKRVERRLGVKPMIYTSPGFWTGWVGNTTRVAKAGFDVLWVSHWQTHRPTVPARRWAGAGWTFWQWTETGKVPGVTGSVDRNVYTGPRLRRMTIKAMRDQGRPGRGGGNANEERPGRPAPR